MVQKKTRPENILKIIKNHHQILEVLDISKSSKLIFQVWNNNKLKVRAWIIFRKKLTSDYKT